MSGIENIDWQAYEDITRYVYDILGHGHGIKATRNCKVRGRSGIEHQIDVLTEQTDGNGLQRTAIECKHWKKKVNKRTIMEHYSVMEDADISKGIIVSSAGFTRDTIAYAQHKGIELVQLREAGKEDLNGKHTLNVFDIDFHINATLTRPTVTCIDFGKHKISDQNHIQSLFYVTMTSDDGKEVPFKNYLTAFHNELHEQPPLKNITKSFNFKGKMARKNAEDIPIEHISFTGFLLEQIDNSIKHFTITDQVWMIMKNVFEQTTFAVTKNGVIFDRSKDA